MRKIFLSWCFALVFCPGVLIAQETTVDYTSLLESIDEHSNWIENNTQGLFDYVEQFFGLYYLNQEELFVPFLPYLANLEIFDQTFAENLNKFFDESSTFYESFTDDVKPAILDIQDATLNIQQDTYKINENLIALYNICNPFFAASLEKFYNRVTFDSDSLLVTDIELRNKITDSNQELQTMNGALSEVLVQLSQIYNMIHNLVDPVTQISNIQDILQQLLDIGVGGGDSTNDIANVLAEWGYQDYGEDYKEAKDNLNSAGEDLNFTIVGYDETTATIETNMHTRSFGRTVSKDNWFEQVQDFLLIIAKASQSQAMSGQLNYLINYENYKSQKDGDKEKKEYEDRISELEQQVGELNQSFSDLEDLITYFQQPSEKKEVFTKFKTEFQNIRLISNELPQYIKLGEFPASWQNIAVSGDLSININDFHPFFRACNSIFGFIYYSLITLFLIWLFSKVPLIIKPLLSLVKNIMTWK